MSFATGNIFETQVISHLRWFRGQAVMLDSDLAWFLGIEPAEMIAEVKNHPEAFPDDFVFHLTRDELNGLHSAEPCLTGGGLSLEQDRFAFTTHGAGMLLVVIDDREFSLAAIPVLRAFANYWNSIESGQLAERRVNRKS